MQQLKMCKIMGQVKPYPLHPDYYIRNIRPDNMDDVDAWVEACREGLIGEAGSRASYTNAITNTPLLVPETDVFLVCDKSNDKVVATLTAHIRDTGEGWIHMVGSLPEVRGKKIGHAMLAVGLERLQKAGVPIARLTTDDWRRPAIKNYLAAGFVPVIFPDDSPDAIPMNERWDKILSEMGWPEKDYRNPDGTKWEG